MSARSDSSIARSESRKADRVLRLIDGELIASRVLMSAGGPWTRPARDVIEPSPLQPTDDTQHLPWGPADPSVFLIPTEELSRCSRLILRGHPREELLKGRGLGLIGRQGPWLETLHEEDVSLRDVIDDHSHAPTIRTISSIPVGVR